MNPDELNHVDRFTAVYLGGSPGMTEDFKEQSWANDIRGWMRYQKRETPVVCFCCQRDLYKEVDATCKVQVRIYDNGEPWTYEPTLVDSCIACRELCNRQRDGEWHIGQDYCQLRDKDFAEFNIMDPEPSKDQRRMEL